MAVKIVTDSTATLTPEQIKENELTICTLFIVQDGVSEPEVDLDYHDFYARLENVEDLPTTSQPTTANFVEQFERILNDGDDVLGIFISGGLSGTMDGALTAKGMIEEKNPDYQGRIALVDSQSCSMTLTYPVLEAAKLAQTGASLEECREAAQFTTDSTRFIFAPKSLEHLARGGRIGRASALLGGVLKLVPLLGPDKNDGTVHTYAKVRTFPKALNTILEKMLDDAEETGGLKALCVHYITEQEEAQSFLKDVVQPAIAKRYPDVTPSFAAISPAIGTHVGPAVGIAYCCAGPVSKEKV